MENRDSARSTLYSAHLRLLETWGGVRVRMAGATIGHRLKAIGAPLVQRHAGSDILLGDDVTLISKSLATALGVNHPVVLRTLARGACIELCEGVGMSGGTICAARLVPVGAETRIGANVTIADTDFHSLHPALRSGHTHESIGVAEVRIGRRVLIGTNCIVLKGVSIGDNSVIGAGSVVTRSIPANSIAAGNPCRVLRQLTPLELGTSFESAREAVMA